MFIRNNKSILKTQQSFKSQRHNDFTKKNQQDCVNFKWKNGIKWFDRSMHM